MPDQDDSLLLYLNDAIASSRSKEALFRTVTEKLRLIFPFDAITIITLDAERQYRRVFLRDYLGELLLPEKGTPGSHKAGPSRIEGTPVELFMRQQHLREYELDELIRQYPDYQPMCLLRDQGMRFFVVVPLRTGGRLIGMLSLVARRRPEFSEADVDLLEKIGSLVAVAVTNTLAFEDIARREQEKSMQLALNNALLSIKERGELFRTIATEINRVAPCDYFGVRTRVPRSLMRAFVEFDKQPDGSFVLREENLYDSLPEAARNLQEDSGPAFNGPGVYVGAAFEELTQRFALLRYIREQRGTQSVLYAPLSVGDEPVTALILASAQPYAYSEETLALIMSLVPQMRLAMQNVFAFEQIEALRTQLERERTYLIDEINTTAAARFGDFVGGSQVMQQVFRRVEQVAPTDTTVLITGETGTGKELVARALHNFSPRKERALIKINCAALPAQLIESELFGHEKGAFTGAHDRRIGKFELADGGTIFLDEIGELPLDLQAKLLRVLQEREIERLGGRGPIAIDVRVIAATNRDLLAEVAAGRFRADLYYRLNVFPVLVPPLRERPEDVLPLALHFLRKLSKQLGKPFTGIANAALQQLQHYRWPGNVRELEYVLERAAILATPPTLTLAEPLNGPPAPLPPPTVTPLAAIKPMADAMRDTILAALAQSAGRIRGRGGAAELLGLKPTTLEARMKKLDIVPPR